MHLNDFMICVRIGQVPREAPDGLSPGGYRFNPDITISYYKARGECTTIHNMWAIVSDDFARQLATWIGERKVLEVMAGAGWLAKALTQNGVNVIATDNYRWLQHNGRGPIKTVHPVRCLRAENAVKKIPADVLLISWPPYTDNTIVKTCEAWGTDRPIVYIGEDEGGCNAPDEFFERFRKDENEPYIPLISWDGIHDEVQIGRWS